MDEEDEILALEGLKIKWVEGMIYLEKDNLKTKQNPTKSRKI